MTLRQLFSIIIKIFGLFLIRDIFFSVTFLVKPIIEMFLTEYHEAAVPAFVISCLIIIFYISIAYMLLFKTESCVDFLKLEPELENDRLTFSVSSFNVMNIAIIIIAGYILIDEIPNFCEYLFKYYESSQYSVLGQPKPSISNLLVSGVKIFLGFLIIGERKQIISYATKDISDNKIND